MNLLSTDTASSVYKLDEDKGKHDPEMWGTQILHTGHQSLIRPEQDKCTMKAGGCPVTQVTVLA